MINDTDFSEEEESITVNILLKDKGLVQMTFESYDAVLDYLSENKDNIIPREFKRKGPRRQNLV